MNLFNKKDINIKGVAIATLATLLLLILLVFFNYLKTKSEIPTIEIAANNREMQLYLQSIMKKCYENNDIESKQCQNINSYQKGQELRTIEACRLINDDELLLDYCLMQIALPLPLGSENNPGQEKACVFIKSKQAREECIMSVAKLRHHDLENNVCRDHFSNDSFKRDICEGKKISHQVYFQIKDTDIERAKLEYAMQCKPDFILNYSTECMRRASEALNYRCDIFPPGWQKESCETSKIIFKGVNNTSDCEMIPLDDNREACRLSFSNDGDVFQDTDADGLWDYQEIDYRTDIRKKDTDGDGLTDGDEIKKIGTNPLDRNTDKDGVDDLTETMAGTDPTSNEDINGKTMDGTVSGFYNRTDFFLIRAEKKIQYAILKIESMLDNTLKR